MLKSISGTTLLLAAFMILANLSPAVLASTLEIHVEGGTLNGVPLIAGYNAVELTPGASITGTVQLGVYNGHPSAAIVPLAATPTWGDPQTSYFGIDPWVDTGYTTYAVNVNLTAPSEFGTYYLVFAMAGVYNYDQLMSGTHPAWPADWINGNKVALLPASDFETSMLQGWIPMEWYSPEGPQPAQPGMNAVRFDVVPEPATLSLLGLGGLALIWRRRR